ncbi:MAG TPA: hypothetical protein VKX17_13700 [Planctomycetota bacterium]|nr:hypothetical protein [Planctomycetota bacterium]
MQDGGVLRFRHPWVLGSDNKGKWIRIGVSKLSPSQQGQLLEDAQALLQKPPLLKSDAPKVGQHLLNPYFKAIKSASRPEYQFDLTRWPSPVVENVETGQREKTELLGQIPDEYYVESGLPPPNIDSAQWFAVMKFIQNLRDYISRIDGLLAAERREVERLNNVIERQNRLIGERGESEKKAVVRECLGHFEKNFRLKEGVSEAQRDDVIRRVKCVLEKLGMDSHYGKANENDLIQAVSASNPKSPRERARRIQAIKRFCTWLCRSKERGGLGFVGNPAAELRPESDKTIQSKRRAEGLVSTLDPVPLIAALPQFGKHGLRSKVADLQRVF